MQDPLFSDDSTLLIITGNCGDFLNKREIDYEFAPVRYNMSPLSVAGVRLLWQYGLQRPHESDIAQNMPADFGRPLACFENTNRLYCILWHRCFCGADENRGTEGVS
jgi:hypothetical protein